MINVCQNFTHIFFFLLNNDSIELRVVSEKVKKDDLFIKVFLTSMELVLFFQPTGCYEGECLYSLLPYI